MRNDPEYYFGSFNEVEQGQTKIEKTLILTRENKEVNTNFKKKL